MIAFLRLVPSWVWVAILLVGVGLWYGQTRYNAGQADVKAEWDKSIDRGKVLLADKEREYRAQEHRHAADMARIGTEHEQERKDASDAAYQRAIADVRSGRLRGVWQCPADPAMPGPGDSTANGHGASDLRAEAVAAVLRVGAEADAHVRACQKVIDADRVKP